MSYSIDEIEGIGNTYKEKFHEHNIKTTEAFLTLCASKKGRVDFAGKSGISETHILDWANMADMMRVNGVGGQFAELLKATGVDTIKELRTRNPENLCAALKDVNEAKHLSKTTPNLDMVTKWIAEAKTMEPMITH